MLTKSQLALRLKELGLKITPQRLEVYSAFTSPDIHPTAMEVYEIVKLHMPTLSFATIYQALNFFCRIGLLQIVDVGDGIMRYDVDTLPHAHIRCETCGKVVNLAMKYHPELDKEAASESSFEIHQHQTYFLGICGECKAKKQ